MKKLFMGICALAVAGALWGQTVPSSTSFAKEALQKQIDSGELPGVITVFYNDGVEEISCLGYADVEHKRPMTLDSMFMQCSQTKGYCGVSVAILVEEGKLSLDDPVSKYLPEFKNLWVLEKQKPEEGKPVNNELKILRKAKNELTLRMCLNHTGGFSFELPNYCEMGGWSRRMPLRSVAATAAALPLNFEPGTKALYSNVGIDIAAAVVEVVTQQRWEQFLQERIFKPLEMKDATFFPTEEQLSRKIELYTITPGKPAVWKKQNSPMQRPYCDDRTFPSAGAGLWITVRDQLKFYKMLMNLGQGENGARILKEETVKRMLASSSRPKDLGGYSMGLSAPVVDNDDQWFGHGGAWQTTCSMNWHKKQLKLAAVQFTGNAKTLYSIPFHAAAAKFFRSKKEQSTDAYTGRMN